MPRSAGRADDPSHVKHIPPPDSTTPSKTEKTSLSERLLSGRRFSFSKTKESSGKEVVINTITINTLSKQQFDAHVMTETKKIREQMMGLKVAMPDIVKMKEENVPADLITKFEELNSDFESVEFNLNNLLPEEQNRSKKEELIKKMQNDLEGITQKLADISADLNRLKAQQNQIEDLRDALQLVLTDMNNTENVPADLNMRFDNLKVEFYEKVLTPYVALSKTTDPSQRDQLIKTIQSNRKEIAEKLADISTDLHTFKTNPELYNAIKLNAIKEASSDKREISELVQRAEGLKIGLVQIQGAIKESESVPQNIGLKTRDVQKKLTDIVSDLDKLMKNPTETALTKLNEDINVASYALAEISKDLETFKMPQYYTKVLGTDYRTFTEMESRDVTVISEGDKSSWEEQRKQFTPQTLKGHPKSLTDDFDRMVLKVNEKEFAGKKGPDQIDSASQEIENSLKSSLKKIKPEFTDDDIQALRHQIEDISNQRLVGTLSSFATDKAMAYAPQGLASIGVDSKMRRDPVIEMTFNKDNTITVTHDYQVEIIDTSGKPVGYDVYRLTVTIDLKEVSNDNLLASDDAVTGKVVSHGFRKTREEISFTETAAVKMHI